MILPRKLLDFNHDLHSSFENITSSLHGNITQNFESITQNFEKNNNSKKCDFNDNNKQYALLDECPPTPAAGNDDNKIKLCSLLMNEKILEEEIDQKKLSNDLLMVLARRACPDGKRRKNRSSLRPVYDRTKSEPRITVGSSGSKPRGKSNNEKKKTIRRHRSGCDDDLMKLRNSNDKRRHNKNTCYVRTKKMNHKENLPLTSKRNEEKVKKSFESKSSYDSRPSYDRSKSEMYLRCNEESNVETTPKIDKRRLNRNKNEAKTLISYKPSYIRSKSEICLTYNTNSNAETNKSITRQRSGNIDMIKMRAIRNIRGKQNDPKNNESQIQNIKKKSTSTRRREQLIRSSSVRQRQLARLISPIIAS